MKKRQPKAAATVEKLPTDDCQLPTTLHHVSVRCDVPKGFEVSSVRGLFDLSDAKVAGEDFDVELPADNDWRIGVIVGPSGSGKTSVARDVYGDAFVERFEWDPAKAVIAQMGGESVKQATHMLSAVGFSSPPSWVKPYHVLSGGERFRCDLARALLLPGELVVFDEFTSVVDRTVAKIGSAAVAKAIRKVATRKRFVAVTCHYDVVDWLEPDWVLDMASRQLARGLLWRRPRIDIEIRRADRSIWSRFSRHHYLDGSLARPALCYAGFHEGHPIAVLAVMTYPHASGGYFREHCLVVLPDYQGIGIGNQISDTVAAAHVATGKRYFGATLHPAIIAYRNRHPVWVMTAAPRRVGRSGMKHLNKKSATARMIATFRYVGAADEQSARALGILREAVGSRQLVEGFEE